MSEKKKKKTPREVFDKLVRTRTSQILNSAENSGEVSVRNMASRAAIIYAVQNTWRIYNEQ